MLVWVSWCPTATHRKFEQAPTSPLKNTGGGWANFSWRDKNLRRVFNNESGCVYLVNLCCFEAKRPNLKLKTCPEHFLGSLPLDIAFHGVGVQKTYVCGGGRGGGGSYCEIDLNVLDNLWQLKRPLSWVDRNRLACHSKQIKILFPEFTLMRIKLECFRCTFTCKA